MDDYNEDFFDDEDQPIFRLERTAFERLGFENALGLGGVINLKKSGYTDIDKFKLIAIGTIVLINDLFDGNIDHSEFNGRNYTFVDAEIRYILNLAEKIPDYKHKNSSAFVLGYIPVFKRFEEDSDGVQKNHKNINKSILEDTFKIYEKIEDDLSTKIDKTDIIRYARLCTNL